MWNFTKSASSEIVAVMSRIARHDVYHRAVFHDYDRMNGFGEVCLYQYEDERGLLAHPFMLRRIETVGDRRISEELYDIETVRALAGPLATSTDPAFLRDAWGAYRGWCRENGVVAEYVRFNPFVDNAKVGSGFFEIEVHQRLGVAVDLVPTESEIWHAQYNVNQRNMVRKAQRLGIRCEFDSSADGFAAFVELQAKAWVRLNARGDRHYPRDALHFLKSGFGDMAPLFRCTLDDRLIAAALFLIGGSVMHYQFAARDAGGSDNGANNLLLHSVALWARERGIKTLHLGAGRTASPQDALFRFKRCLSPNRVGYARGFCCYMPDVFQRLCDMWLAQTEEATLPLHSMPYREPLPHRLQSTLVGAAGSLATRI